jgi:hypothetical protein
LPSLSAVSDNRFEPFSVDVLTQGGFASGFIWLSFGFPASFPLWASTYSAFASPISCRMNTTISILAEIPEDLHQALTGYLETHSNWDHDSILAAALSLFLLQSGSGDRHAGQIYLETLYQRPMA